MIRRLSVLAAVLLGLVTVPGTALAAPKPADIKGQTVRAGHLRVQVLSPTLLRLEYAADDRFEDRPTFNAVDRSPGRTWFQARVEKGELNVRTSAVTLRYKLDSGPVGAANTTLDLGRTRIHPDFKTQPGNTLGGWYRGLDYYAGQAGPVDQLTLHPGLLDKDGWYLLDDTATAVKTADNWVAPRPARTSAYQDGYLFGYGHDYTQALKDLRTLTGPSVLPPEWAFGTWFSKYNAYSTNDYETSLLPAFQQHQVPLDSLVADTDWKAPNQWAGWNWNSSLFPDPAAFIKDLQKRGINLTLNVHAAISGDDPKFAQAQATAKGKLQPSTNSFAPDPYRFDWGDPDQAAAFEQLHQPFEKDGVRQWWLDYCCDDSTVSTPGVTPDSWVNELYRRDGEARGLRGFALSRIGSSFPAYTTVGASGPWAEHRSTVHFTGDTEANFATLAFAAAMTPGEGASIGQSYVSHDIGSFAGKHDSDDLYLRWIQLAAFQPILRLHSDHGDRLPWEYSDAVSGPAADFLRLRESLVPYLYTAARQNYDTGLPMTRALYLTWPGQDQAYQHDTEYTLGDSLLVAPVTTPGLSTTGSVWFPPGTWTDFFTGETFRGPATRTVSATPSHMPVYVRAGGILAQRDGSVNVAHQNHAQLTLTAYPHASGQISVYEDAGDGLAYRTGQSARIPVRYNEGRFSSMTVGPVVGGYPGAPASRSYTVAFADVSKPHVVTVDGRPAPWTYAGAKHLLTVTVPAVASGRRVTVAHDGAALTLGQQPAVDVNFTAPDGLQSGAKSTLVTTAHNSGPGTVTNVAATVDAPAGWVVTPRGATTAAALAPGATFTATYDVVPSGPSPRSANVTAHVAYKNPDGTAASLPAALTVPLRPVAVTFRVAAPPGTPPDATLYVPGSIAQLGPWDPAKQPMTYRGNGIWEATVSILDGTDVQYKYTRGSWETVEEWGSITGTNNRGVTIDGGITHTMLVDDTSTDPSTPDIHRAIQFWRDPLVVSTAAAANAVTVKFQRDIQPSGADYAGAVTVTGPAGAVSGTVAETDPGTLVWTPAAPLPAGSYSGVVSQVNSAVSDGVPIAKPYTFSFTVS
ncbi:TIM-barrel domain-containing protein [Actinoplanes sp. NPDC051343]|uniref:TIM-barrel domain-containing protein n=1 Tax=Actinoplanes sp. NPDC051343 TaxID=3363906 RepID=UPI0037944C97